MKKEWGERKQGRGGRVRDGDEESKKEKEGEEVKASLPSCVPGRTWSVSLVGIINHATMMKRASPQCFRSPAVSCDLIYAVLLKLSPNRCHSLNH